MNEDLLFGLKLTLVGNIVVFSALTLIYWIMTGFKAVEERIQKSAKHKKEVKEPAETPASAEPTAEPQLQPELVAAISAAIAVVVDKKFQILEKASYETNTSKSQCKI